MTAQGVLFIFSFMKRAALRGYIGYLISVTVLSEVPNTDGGHGRPQL